jgi:hypothetical protein
MGKDEPPRGNKEPTSAEKHDVVFIHGPVERGDGFQVVRAREDRIELGELRPVEEGRPLHGDLVRLKQREDHTQLFDVEVLCEAPRGPAQRGGPAQVATDAYRTNWEAIFGERDKNKITN